MSNVTAGAPGKGGLHHGWLMVVAAFIGFGLVYGTTLYSFSIFANPLATALGVPVKTVAWASTFFNVGTGVVGIFGGQLLARFPIKYMMMAGLLVLALGFLALSTATNVHSVWGYYAVLVAFGGVIVAPMGASALIANWFHSHRGKALTLSTLGTSVGQFALPPLATLMIASHGWQFTYQMYAVLLVIAIPIMFFLVVDKPEDKGMEPVGGNAVTNGPAPAKLTTGQIVGNPDFWVVGISYSLTVVVYLGITTSIVSYGKGAFHIDTAQTAKLALSMGIAAIIGKFFFTAVTDRIGLRNTFWISVVLNLISAGVLVFAPSQDHLVISAVCTGASAGGVLPVWPGLIALRFGRQRMAQVMGVMSPMVLCVQGLGFPIAAAYGYTLVYKVFIAFLILSAIISYGLTKPGKAASQ